VGALVDAVERFIAVNAITLLILIVISVSVLQGMTSGASGSAKRLVRFMLQGGLTVLSLFAAWQWSSWSSPKLRDWLAAKPVDIPDGTLSVVQQIYYTLLTGLKDFSLLRFALLYMIGYVFFRSVLNLCFGRFVPAPAGGTERYAGQGLKAIASRAAGGLIGGLIGCGRSLLLIALLFIFVSLFPHSTVSVYAQSSSVYQRVAQEILYPFAGDFLAEQAPVFKRAVEDELTGILQRKYEIIDHHIPDQIGDAARTIVEGARTDREKAERLYDWVGTRIAYDHEKVRLYEDERIWKEQTPEETFRTRKGVCIDYARLYAMMARSVGLDARVATGLGYDGRGAYGPHAWNEVYLRESGEWIPLDATWAVAGNWFDSPDFYETHIKDRTIGG
jgi:hypothetical protein